MPCSSLLGSFHLQSESMSRILEVLIWRRERLPPPHHFPRFPTLHLHRGTSGGAVLDVPPLPLTFSASGQVVGTPLPPTSLPHAGPHPGVCILVPHVPQTPECRPAGGPPGGRGLLTPNSKGAPETLAFPWRIGSKSLTLGGRVRLCESPPPCLRLLLPLPQRWRCLTSERFRTPELGSADLPVAHGGRGCRL